jgi:NAD(P)-dependent dehydrogenase (short-subunit alcohol dehydrogenase family)
MSSLAGKTALVTGAKGGLGAAIADELHDQGAKVFGTSRNIEDAELIASKYGTSPVVLDISDTGSIKTSLKSLWDSEGPVHLLCNNAGINAPQAALDVDEHLWQRVMDTNVNGTFFTTQTLARYWVAEGIHASVVSIGSQAATVAIEERVAYGSSKAAMAHMTRVLAFEWGQYGIRVNAVAPTFIWTDLTASTLGHPGMEEKLTSRIPLGRLGVPADVAPAVAFLLSEQASLITGHILAIDGGYTIH